MLFQSGKFILIIFFLFYFSYAQNNSENDKMYVSSDPKSESYLDGIESGVQGNFELAKAQFEATLKQNPSHLSAKNKLRVISDVLENKIQKPTAIGIFKGMKFSLSQNAQEAIKEFSRAIENEPEYDELYRLRGRSYIDLKDYSKAFQDYNTALNLNPANTSAIMNRANAYLYTGTLDSALLDFNRVAALLPDEAYVFLSPGTVYSQMDKFDNAIQDYNKVIELNPSLAIVYYNKGIVCELAGRETDALKSFKNFVGIATNEYRKAIDYSKIRIQELESKQR